MYKAKALVMMAGVGVGFLTLSACVSTGTSTTAPRDAAGMHQIQRLVNKVTAHKYRAFRKPVRDEQAKNLRRLAETTDRFIAETNSWTSPARLTSVGEGERDEVRAAVDAFRTSLGDLKNAAAKSDKAAVRTSYSAAMASYRKLSERIDVSK